MSRVIAIVATVSVGANTDANANADGKDISNGVPRVHTIIPHAIQSIDNIVPKVANDKDANQFFRKLAILNFKEECNKIGGSIKYKNISGANSKGAFMADFHIIEIIIPRPIANTEEDTIFTCLSHNNTIEINTNINTKIKPSVS